MSWDLFEFLIDDFAKFYYVYVYYGFQNGTIIIYDELPLFVNKVVIVWLKRSGATFAFWLKRGSYWLFKVRHNYNEESLTHLYKGFTTMNF